MMLKDWSIATGINSDTIRYRLQIGMPFDSAIETPIMEKSQARLLGIPKLKGTK